MEPIFFRSPEEFRAWLQEHHATERELLLGFYKKRSGVTGFTQAQAVDEALCFGWIDGHVKSLDEHRYTARFTPRKPHSIWSAVNLRRAEQLIADGKMQPAGLQTFTGRDPRQAGRYSFENRPQSLDEVDEAQFRANASAWEFFQVQAPSYQRTAIWWIVSAKTETTRRKRLTTLIQDSAERRKLKHLSYGSAAPRSSGGSSSRASNASDKGAV
ncbi:MAG TPA: YdeI/OmpD-associated family protein [Ktedonobacterales bacterium]